MNVNRARLRNEHEEMKAGAAHVLTDAHGKKSCCFSLLRVLCKSAYGLALGQIGSGRMSVTRITRSLGASSLIFVLASCVTSSHEARMELGKRDWQYSPEGFVQAVALGDQEAVRLFLAAGIDVDTRGKRTGDTALMIAIRNNRLQVAKLLLKKGANPHDQTEEDNVLTHALASRSRKMLEFAQEISGERLPAPPTITIFLTGDGDVSVPLQMVCIPAGSLESGSATNEHLLSGSAFTVGHSFYMGKHEVTQAQWGAVMGYYHPSRFLGRQRPVEQVSWNDCQAFIQGLNALGQGVFRLPTLVEWEYACRAGSTSRYHWGDDPQYLLIYAWASTASKGPSGTQAVGLRLPNAFGLFDMTGNVREWCQDAAEDVRPPSRYVRGGCYGGGENLCRSGYKQHEFETTNGPSIGFRVVMEGS